MMALNPRLWMIAGSGAAILFAVFHIWFAWIGFMQSDDLSYAVAAQAWVENGPNLAKNHWGLRHAIVLPTAFLFAAFGPGEATLMATAVAYTAALLAIAHRCAMYAGGSTAGAVAVTCLIAVPMVATGASFLTADIPEAVFLLGSLLAFYFAWQGTKPWLFVAAGVLAGLAAITRETAAGLLLFYLILFVAGYGGDRLKYFWMVPGFLAVFGADTIALWLASGDPLYRFNVTLGGVSAVNAELVSNNRAAAGFDTTGVMAAPRWLKPITMLFANQQIGPIAWLGVPAMIVVAVGGRHLAAWKLPRLLALFALLWFVCTTYMLYRSLYLIPRYQVVTMAIMAICIGLVFTRAATPMRRAAVGAAVAGLMAAGVLLTGVSDREFMFSEREVVRIARELDEPVWTDPASRLGAEWLLTLNGDGQKVVAGHPPPGGLFILNSRPRRPLPADWTLTSVPDGWTVIARRSEPARPFVGPLRSIGVWRFLPEPVIRKLDPEPRTTMLVRRPDMTPVN